MDARVFRGRTSREALQSVRDAFGEEAAIIATRTIKSDAGNGSSFVEVTAAPATVNSPTNTVGRLTPLAPPPPNTAAVEGQLKQFGVSHSLAATLATRYLALGGKSDLLDRRTLAQALAASLPTDRTRTASRISAFIGATGVGKTTTIAKLATLDTLAGRSVALVTIDTHRIGGVEQLSRYAQLLRTPIAAPKNPEQLAETLVRFSSVDKIYVDTAGSSPWDEERLHELFYMLGGCDSAERVLLVPGSGNERDLNTLIHRFLPLGVSRLGVTKVDETSYFGPCFSALCGSGIPVSLIANGQNVPEDLEHASASKLIELLTRVMH